MSNVPAALSAMSAKARQTWNALVHHLESARAQYAVPKGILTSAEIRRYCIAYKPLCLNYHLHLRWHHSVPAAVDLIDPYLLEIGQACQVMDWPPLHALAVNEAEGYPGPSYDHAGGFRLATWNTDVQKSIRFTFPSIP